MGKPPYPFLAQIEHRPTANALKVIYDRLTATETATTAVQAQLTATGTALTTEQVQALIKQALLAGLAGFGLYGQWEEGLLSGVVYPNASDSLWLVLYTDVVAATTLIQVLADSANPPTTLRGKATSGVAAGGMGAGSILVPVRAGENVLVSPATANPTITVQRLPV